MSACKKNHYPIPSLFITLKIISVIFAIFAKNQQIINIQNKQNETPLDSSPSGKGPISDAYIFVDPVHLERLIFI